MTIKQIIAVRNIDCLTLQTKKDFDALCEKYYPIALSQKIENPFVQTCFFFGLRCFFTHDVPSGQVWMIDSEGKVLNKMKI